MDTKLRGDIAEQAAEAEKRQRKPRSAEYRNAWTLILQGAVREDICRQSPLKFEEAVKPGEHVNRLEINFRRE